MTREDIILMIDEWLAGTGFYLVECEVLPVNRIGVYIDSETGVTIEDCVNLSRFIEKQLDRESLDFELNVSSAGMDRPLRHPRQFIKATNKLVELRLRDGKKVEGLLKEVGQDHYLIEAKPKKSNKKTTQEEDNLLSIPINEVKEVRRLVTFS